MMREAILDLSPKVFAGDKNIEMKSQSSIEVLARKW